MYENLNIHKDYDGFLFLAESALNPPILVNHHHVELELNLVANGRVTYVVEGKKVNYQKGDLLWFPSMQEHQLVSRSPDAMYYVAVFTPTMLQNTCQNVAYTKLSNNDFQKNEIVRSVLAPQEHEELRKIMDALIEDGPDSKLLNREAGFGRSSDFRYYHKDPDWLNAGLRFLLLKAWRYQQKREVNKSVKTLHLSVKKAIEVMNQHDNFLSLDQIAESCNVSASYLSRIFHKQLGVTISNYRNGLRLKHFWNSYYGGKNSTILEAVYDAGFGSYSQFYRAFTDSYNRSPKELIQQVEQKV